MRFCPRRLLVVAMFRRRSTVSCAVLLLPRSTTRRSSRPRGTEMIRVDDQPVCFQRNTDRSKL
eukprot:5926069-Prymnesium_polylepis.1